MVLDLIHTLAFSGVALLVGYGLRRAVPFLHAYNFPAPVLGGLLVAIVVTLARSQGVTLFTFDTTLQSPLMIAFFTTVGFGASLSLLRAGGPQVVRFLVIASVFAVVQNVVGVLVAMPFGVHALFGVLAGSVTLTGGPATALAFAPLFEKAGVVGAGSIGIAAAMGGIVAGSLIGGPVGTWLVRRYGLESDLGALNRRAAGSDTARRAVESGTARRAAEREAFAVAPARSPVAVPAPALASALSPTLPPATTAAAAVAGESQSADSRTFQILKNLVAILVAMWIGSWVSRGVAALGVTLPAYIGAMLVAAILRNVDDATGWLRLSHRFIDGFGAVSLSLFLAMALMTLKLWELSGLALPLITVLLVQIVITAAVAAGPVFKLMGRDYESAVMSGGFLGFMLGTTANAMAVMHTLVERYGPAPRAFLVAPMVGAFFLDFTNALVITAFLNILA